MRLLILASVLTALSACTTIPEQIQGTYPEITPARVEPSVFGSDVRWGGVIVSTTAVTAPIPVTKTRGRRSGMGLENMVGDVFGHASGNALAVRRTGRL